MQVREDHPSLVDALPKAARVLQDLRGVPTFEDAYGARHPFGAYNISLSAIGSRAVAVSACLSELEHQFRLQPSRHDVSDHPLLEATDHFLDSLMEHMDVCGGIIRSFFPPADEKRFKKQLTSFKSSVEPYRKHIGNIDNYIKHSQGKLRSVRFAWPMGMCFGYFVEGPVATGILGPVNAIHPGSNSAFSFNRDIPFHLCNVFAIGAHLAHSLYEIERKLVPLSVPKQVDVRDSDWTKALRAAAALQPIFFPDEIPKPVPRIQLSERRVLIEYPAARSKIAPPPSPSQISLTFAGDGVTRSFKMPYFNEES